MNYLIFVLAILINTIFAQSSNSTPKILVKFPTRERPEKFFKQLDLYYANLSNEYRYEFVVSCDLDDPTMNCQDSIEKLTSYPHLSFYFGTSNSKVNAINRDIEKHSFDILLLASDDMTPVIQSYDQIIVKNMLQFFPDLDGTLHFNDSHTQDRLNTFPIMGKKYYERFNYIYNPEYFSIRCDLEYTLISQRLNKSKYIDQVLFRHDHPLYKFPLDSLHKKNETVRIHHHDNKVFYNRQKSKFYIESQSNYLGSSLNLNTKNQKILWSILIPTLDKRTAQFKSLYQKLLKQIKKENLNKEIEIVYFKDNKQHSIGHKRNELVKKAQGKYISFIDDDDDVSEEYIKTIYNKLLLNPDCVSMAGIINSAEVNINKFVHSSKYKHSFKQDDTYYRPPNHLNPIKRKIVMQFKFKNISNGEDTAWAASLNKSHLIKKEEEIINNLYFYNYDPTKSERSSLKK